MSCNDIAHDDIHNGNTGGPLTCDRDAGHGGWHAASYIPEGVQWLKLVDPHGAVVGTFVVHGTDTGQQLIVAVNDPDTAVRWLNWPWRFSLVGPHQPECIFDMHGFAVNKVELN